MLVGCQRLLEREQVFGAVVDFYVGNVILLAAIVKHLLRLRHYADHEARECGALEELGHSVMDSVRKTLMVDFRCRT